MTENKDYQVLKAGPIAGLFRKKGDEINLNNIDAQTYLSQGKIKPVITKKTGSNQSTKEAK